ncbi:LolA family protein [Cryobacterium roopkundense]|uniref:Outer membrane lipoprotein-sorting protein n=1 Tax=Cryobacterium roopkundense TaxID=1001240 RepID=A0A7W9E4A9_9MICO|nr:DUF2092 domain-containing protein [Cryobacterium roopkundense]MBB5641229.1 outer membrane lipoprotein-sorting protein [Cryobacterium roopkundense]
MPRTSVKWLPAIVVPAVIAVGVIAVPLQAGAAIDLPDKTAEQILLMVNDSTVTAFSGALEQSSDIGLPDVDLGAGMSGSLPEAAGAGAVTSALEFLTGSHEARVYVDGADRTRVQILDKMDERDLIVNGTDAWTYDSQTNEVSHLAIPAELKSSWKDKAAAREAQAPTGLATPAQIAEHFLTEINPTTAVSVGNDGTVAGRTVYELVLNPNTSDTLVESVTIAVDSETGLPLRVTVAAVGQKAPAFQLGFTSLDLSVPSADRFDFTPPAGATVTEVPVPTAADMEKMKSEAPQSDAAPVEPTSDLPVIAGSGWDAVAEIAASSVPAELSANPLLAQLTTEVTGGRALSTSLVNVFLATDGRVFVGSVPLERLQAAAAVQ